MNYWIFIATVIALLPVFFIKKYILTKNYKYLLACIPLYLMLVISYINLFKNDNIGAMYTILQILQILLVVIGGIIIFKEKVDTNKVIGITFGLLSIYYLQN